MDMKHLLHELGNAQEFLTAAETTQHTIVTREMEALISFVPHIFGVTKKKTINGENTILLYVFPIGEKELISHEVYLTEKGEITYQVYDERLYKGYRPDADITNGYVKITLFEFLKVKPLSDIYDFFRERPSVLNDRTNNLNTLNGKRTAFLKTFEQSLNEL